MKASLEPGLTFRRRITVDRDRTISFMGEDARVYATPRLVSDVEYTCRDGLIEHCDPGEDSVGIAVALEHLAPTLAGSTVEISVRIQAIDRRKVTFEVSATDELDVICRGTHARFVVDLPARIARLREKQARLAALKA